MNELCLQCLQNDTIKKGGRSCGLGVHVYGIKLKLLRQETTEIKRLSELLQVLARKKGQIPAAPRSKPRNQLENVPRKQGKL